MKKILLFSITLCLTCTLSACSNSSSKANKASNQTEDIYETSSQTNDYSSDTLSHIEVLQSDGTGKEFLNVPLYYNEDYPAIQKEYQSTSAMSLLTCLSMINSYYSSSYVTPTEYSTAHESILSATVDQNISDMAKSVNMTVDKYNFDTEKLSDLLVTDRKLVLLYIPHSSKFGSYSSFLILTGADAGDIFVRDPNSNNSNLYRPLTEPSCDYFTLCEQASSSSFMYVFNDIPTK